MNKTGTCETFADPRVNMRALLLDRETAPTLGAWVGTEGYDKFSIHVVKGSGTTLSAQAYVSNEPSPAVDGGVAYGSPVAASAYIEIKAPYRWIRMAAPTLSGGVVSAYLEAV